MPPFIVAIRSSTEAMVDVEGRAPGFELVGERGQELIREMNEGKVGRGRSRSGIASEERVDRKLSIRPPLFDDEV